MLGAAIVREEAARSQRERPNDPDAFDFIVRAQALRNEPTNLRRYTEAKALLENAVELDPRSLLAIIGLVHVYQVLYADRGYFWLDGDEPERLTKLIADAQAIAPADEAVLVRTANWLQVQGHYEAGMAVSRRIIDTYPRNPNGYAILRGARSSVASSTRLFRCCKRRSSSYPDEPHLFDRYWRLGFACLLSKRDPDALAYFQRALGLLPDAPELICQNRYRHLAASYALIGDIERARSIVTEFIGASHLMTLRCLGYENYRCAAYAAQYARYRDGLRLAACAITLMRMRISELSQAMSSGPPLPAGRCGRHQERKLIGTAALARFVERHTPIIIDTLGHFWGTSLPNAIGLPDAGIGGRLTDSLQVPPGAHDAATDEPRLVSSHSRRGI